MNPYGNSFGWRLSPDRVGGARESKLRVPANATAATGWLQGAIVTIDPDTPGYLKLAADDAPIIPGVTGILEQREYFQSANLITTQPVVTSRDSSAVRPGYLANIVTGAGAKVWLKNLASQSATANVRAYDAETRVNLANIVVGSFIGWGGTGYEVKNTEATAIGVVTEVTTTGCVFTLLR